MEAIILYLLLWLGLPVGNSNQTPPANQKAQTEKSKGNSGSDSLIAPMGGTGNWENTDLASQEP